MVLPQVDLRGCPWAFRTATRTSVAGLGGSAKATRPRTYYLSATYFDTEELDLLKNRITLRRRVGGADEGWHLKLPGAPGHQAGNPRGPRRRVTRQAVPAELAAQVKDVIGGRPLHPVAILDTERTVLTLTGRWGEPLAEVADDLVTATRLDEPGAEPVRWREIEVEAGREQRRCAARAGSGRPGAARGGGDTLIVRVQARAAARRRLRAGPGASRRARGFQRVSEQMLSCRAHCSREMTSWASR